ncbi:DUF6544 family protein [Devosia nitrariae]|uniref:DUF6544 family protein n=1 Tax=Devosia nitrariae TaxID=2071872 RepID=UPI0024E1438F|nr:DUF6544 family protein [Devosia nitrariae]
MSILKLMLLALGLLVVLTAVVAHAFFRIDMREAHRAWADFVAPEKAAGPFDPEMLVNLPEPARRYLTYSILRGTPLKMSVQLHMKGTFALGDRKSHRVMTMEARQMLSPPRGFVWIPEMGSGMVRIWGSDGYAGDKAWTRFWVWGLIPVARLSSTGDLALSAAGRSIMEAIWAPASLLPQNGARWAAVGDDAARVTFEVEGEPLTLSLTLSEEGRPLTVSMMRWSNANPEGIFRWQSFGGTIEETGEFGGYVIPTRVEVGNHYGTGDYFPFFRVRIVDARYR